MHVLNIKLVVSLDGSADDVLDEVKAWADQVWLPVWIHWAGLEYCSGEQLSHKGLMFKYQVSVPIREGSDAR